MSAPARLALLMALVVCVVASRRADAGGCVTDAHGRDIESCGITLVDWEGQIANPLIPFNVTPPADGAYPIRLIVRGDNSRLYFNTFSEGDDPLFFRNASDATGDGPWKFRVFDTCEPIRLWLSIFPDRDGEDETHTLTLFFTDAAEKKTETCVDVRVIDQDRDRPPTFKVRTDFSYDRSGIFDNPKARAVVEQAAADWAYFIDDMDLDVVGPGQEATRVWNYPLAWEGRRPRSFWASNKTGYRGFLIYAIGLETKEIRARGGAINQRVQHSRGQALPLRRSGAIMFHTRGAFTDTGWFINNDDADWWHSDNGWHAPHDFYSVALHEVGHALAFDFYHPGFRDAQRTGLRSGALEVYCGSTLKCDGDCHFSGVVDWASGMGAFGNRYEGCIPARRWLITKTDLLLLEAIGYRLRSTSGLQPLECERAYPPVAVVGAPYTYPLRAGGGVPAYWWGVYSGALPDGLEIDSWSGEISGTPTRAGIFKCMIALRDAWNGVTCISPVVIGVRERAAIGAMVAQDATSR